MIRVAKSFNVPESLSAHKSYKESDVLKQLEKDHHNKCYLCERALCTDFQVEHLKSRENNTHLTYVWENLFWVCGYCNGKKLQNFDGIVVPFSSNVELEIIQSINFSDKKAEFVSCNKSEEFYRTIELLRRIHNGTNKIRTMREEKFFEYIVGVVNNFQRLVGDYLQNPSEKGKNLIREELQIDKECLGFKYWIIKSNTLLENTFSEDIIWNKQ